MSQHGCLAVIALSWIVLSGCVSLSSMQPAETLAPGRTSGYIAIASQAVTHSNDNVENENTRGDGQNGLTFWEVGSRLGIAYGVDIGMRTNFQFGSFFSDVKFRLLQWKGLTISSGVGVGYLALDASANEGDTNLQIYELHIPIYSTFELSKYVDVAVTPRLIQRHMVGQGDSVALGGSTALFVGSNTRGVLEYAMFSAPYSNEIVHQVTAGVILGYAKNRHPNKKERVNYE